MFYLATAMLSHRLKTISSLPASTAARVRQQLSATQVIRYLQNKDRLTALRPLPVIVYATSLALSVSYQQLRYSRLSADQDEAYQDFMAACNILETFQHQWSAADAMALLSRRIAIELDKTPNLATLRLDREREEARRNEPRIQSWQHQSLQNDSFDLDQDEQYLDSGIDTSLRPSTMAMSSLETFDVFGGMDDMSWMYLDGENPMSLDNMPWLGYDFGFDSGVPNSGVEEPQTQGQIDLNANSV